MGFLSNLISAIPIVGDVIGTVGGIYQQESANRANMKLAQYQYEKNLEMWNLNNEYNTPKAQMQRFAEAGLNPNLIYGQGTAGNSSSYPQYKAPEIKKYTNFGDLGASGFVQAYNATRQTEANIELAKSQKQLAEANARKSDTESALNVVRKLRDSLGYDIDRETKEFVVNLAKQRLKEATAHTELVNQQSLTEQSRRSLMSIEVDLKRNLIEQGNSRIQLNNAQISLMAAEIGKIAQDILESQSRVSLNEENVKKVSQEITNLVTINDQGQVNLDISRFKSWWERTYRVPFGNTERQALGAVIVGLGKRTAEWLQDLYRRYW